MNTRITLGFAALITAFGMGSTWAAPSDVAKSAVEPNAMFSPQANAVSAFSSLKTSNQANMAGTTSKDVSGFQSTTQGLARPNSGQSWSNGIEALMTAAPSAAMSSSEAAERAMTPPPGTGTNVNGLTTIKRSADFVGSGASLDAAQSTSAKTGDHLFSRAPN
jgi:hypothetical protein